MNLLKPLPQGGKLPVFFQSMIICNQKLTSDNYSPSFSVIEAIILKKRRFNKIMEISIYNSLKSRLEAIDIEFTKENTTWFDDCEHDNNNIYRITDFNSGILIKEFGYSYPIWIYGETRASIAYDQRKAKKLKCMID